MQVSKEEVGACLEQKRENVWQPIAYAGRYLNKNEQRYSTKELEQLAVVWSLERFKYYLRIPIHPPKGSPSITISI